MRILHLLHTTDIGGVETAAGHLRAQLSPEHRYRIAAFRGPLGEMPALKADAVGYGLNSPRSVIALLRLIHREDPDLLVTSLWRAVAVGLLARALPRRRGGGARRWAIWVHNAKAIQPVDGLVHRLALPRADLVLCDSRAAADEFAAPLLSGPAGQDVPLHLVRPDAAPLSGAAPRVPSPQERLELLFIGRIAPQKGLERSLEIVAELLRQRPAGAHLRIVGPDGSSSADVRRRIQELGLHEAVTLTGPADRAQLAQEISAAHAFIQTSHSEGFAMAAHEALACGMVSVLTPVGDLAHDTHDGVDAIHHLGDARRTAQRLIRLSEDPAAWQEMSARARTVRGAHMADEFREACGIPQPARRGEAAG